MRVFCDDLNEVIVSKVIIASTAYQVLLHCGELVEIKLVLVQNPGKLVFRKAKVTLQEICVIMNMIFSVFEPRCKYFCKEVYRKVMIRMIILCCLFFLFRIWSVNLFRYKKK